MADQEMKIYEDQTDNLMDTPVQVDSNKRKKKFKVYKIEDVLKKTRIISSTTFGELSEKKSQVIKGTLGYFLSMDILKCPNYSSIKNINNALTYLNYAFKNNSLVNVEWIFEHFQYYQNYNDLILIELFKFPDLDLNIMKFILSKVDVNKYNIKEINKSMAKSRILENVEFYFDVIFNVVVVDEENLLIYTYLNSVIKDNNQLIFKYLLNKFSLKIFNKDQTCLLTRMCGIYMSDDCVKLFIDFLKDLEFDFTYIQYLCIKDTTMFYCIEKYPFLLEGRISKFLLQHVTNKIVEQENTFLLKFLLINKVKIYKKFITDLVKKSLTKYVRHLIGEEHLIYKNSNDYFYAQTDEDFIFLYETNTPIEMYKIEEVEVKCSLIKYIIVNNLLLNGDYFDKIVKEFIDRGEDFSLNESYYTSFHPTVINAFYKYNVNILNFYYYLNYIVSNKYPLEFSYWYKICFLINKFKRHNFCADLVSRSLTYKNYSAFFWLRHFNFTITSFKNENDKIFFENMSKEIDCMKKNYINTLSIYDIFVSNEKLIKYCDNVKMTKFCNQYLVKKYFKPMYLLRLKLYKLKKFQQIEYITKLCQLDENIVFNYLPQEINNQIVNHLKDSNLKVLCNTDDYESIIKSSIFQLSSL